MNITSDTVAILKNFSDINQNILVKPGNQLQTISTLKIDNELISKPFVQNKNLFLIKDNAIIKLN